MTRAALVHEHFDVRVLTGDRSRRARVIEVDMREQQLPHVAETDAAVVERRCQRRHRRRRPRVEQRDAGRAVQDRRRDDLRASQEVEIEVVETCGERGHPVTPPSTARARLS